MTQINACICTIGDEILIGQIVDSNSAYIANQLDKEGIKTDKILSIGDDSDTIISELKSLTEKYSIIITTGGLGPTRDDITKKAVMNISESKEMVYSSDQMYYIEKIFSARGLKITPTNHDQALVPDKCSIIPNKIGTAPCMYFKKNGCIIFSLPGVPYEMKLLIPEIITTIKQSFYINSIVHKTISTYGIPESTLSDTLSEWETNLPDNIKLAYLPDPAKGIRLRLSTYNGDKEKSTQIINKLSLELKSFLSKEIIYGEDNDTLESIVLKLLRDKRYTLAAAESCTGGRIASLITSIPGASEVFKGGVVAYSNQSKELLLNVDSETLKKHGAVSKECAKEMAAGVKLLFNTDYAISTTGIAGPTGGSEEKPIGTIWIGIAGPHFCDSFLFQMSGDRERNTIRSASTALNLLRKQLQYTL